MPSGGRRTPSEDEVLSALRTHRWQVEPAAAQLGMKPEALFAMMEKQFNRGTGRKKSGRKKSGR